MEMGLVWLINTVWIASIVPIVLASLPSSRVTSFYECLMGSMKRGKIMPSSSPQRFTVPQSFFVHFYVAAVAWTTLLLVTSWTYAYKSTTEDSHILFSVWRSVFLLLLMEVQVLRRLYETLYVFNYSSFARCHIFGYLIGYFFYTLAPLSLCYNHAHEVYKFTINGVAEMLVKSNINELKYGMLEFISALFKLGWLQWAGAAIFFWGWIHQRNCHKILGSLRNNKTQKDSYMIPYGDWFELVSSAHFLAEIVIYVGFVVASGGADLSVWLTLGFTVSNLTFTAAETQRWYHRKFENYPSNRRSIFPFEC